MSDINRWLLPAGIEEELPDNARRIENLRRKVLDLFEAWGYRLVIPPVIEYLESLLVIDDERLNLQTLKLIDQSNGRVMGVRADITPQVARIDAHRLHSDKVSRLCYVGTVLRAKSENISGVRAMMQIGAEIYGHAGTGSDIETVLLMSATMETVGIKDIYIDIGHVGIYTELAQLAGLSSQQAETLSGLIQIKAVHEVRAYLLDQGIDSKYESWFTDLVSLHGDTSVLKEARSALKGAGVDKFINEIEDIMRGLEQSGITAKCDLGELGGYHYEAGAVYTVFVKGLGQEIARGGRYDNIGRVFGRARPATGFSSDLTLLASASVASDNLDGVRGIFAPASDDVELRRRIAELRMQGERIVVQLDVNEQAGDFDCDRVLVLENDTWKVQEI